MIRIRFVTCDDPISAAIRLQAGICMPFTPSHTEALTPDGKSYIGAHAQGGVAAKPVGYDADQLMTLPSGKKSKAIVSLPSTDEQEAAFYAFLQSKIGEPYDWGAILDFADPDLNLHAPDHIICSALQSYALRKAEWFQWPLTVPFHHISPRDLFLSLSTHVKIDH